MNVRERIADGFYTRFERDAMTRRTLAKEKLASLAAKQDVKKQFQADLEEQHGFDKWEEFNQENRAKPAAEKIRKKLDLLFSLAWEQGHSSGLLDVESCYEEMAELVK